MSCVINVRQTSYQKVFTFWYEGHLVHLTFAIEPVVFAKCSSS